MSTKHDLFINQSVVYTKLQTIKRSTKISIMNADEILKNALNILEGELEVNEGEALPVMLSCINLSEFIFQSCSLKLSLLIFAIVHDIPIF